MSFVSKPSALSIQLLLLVLTATVILIPVTANSNDEPQVPPYTLVSLKALLFYENTGTFSENILDNPKFKGLWNTIIGAGPAGSPSNSTLVLVETRGKPGSYEPKRKIQFTAIERANKTTTKLKRTSQLGVLSEKEGKIVSGFWLYDTGCLPIDITASLIGQTPTSTLHSVIPFECGE